jgi:hypothetical protein
VGGNMNKDESKNGNPFTYEYVCQFVINNSKVELLSKEYINSTTMLDFKCSCGELFQTTFNRFKNHKKRQCGECGVESRKKKTKINALNRKYYTHDDVNKFFENQGCALLSKKYVRSDDKLDYICSCGEVARISFSKFKIGQRCKKCKGKRANAENVNDIKYIRDYIQGEKYKLLDNEYTNNKKKLTIECPDNHRYKVTWKNFYKGKRCPTCAEKSHGNRRISNFLDKKSVKHKKEAVFEECRHYRKLPFDICIDGKLLIEFDGEQHFRSIDFFSNKKGDVDKNFKGVIKRDKIKNDFSVKNNINLIRIPYWERKNIEKIMEDILGYFKIIKKDNIDKNLVESFLVNHPEWSHEKYLRQAPCNKEKVS